MYVTGVMWIDWLIISAAAVAAVSTLYYKALRPFWRGIRRARVFFDKVENLFDMGDELAPEVRNSLFATQAKLVSGHDEIMQLLASTNERIDAHMNAEEDSLEKVATSIEGIESTLSGHMASDTRQFLNAHEALAQGQGELIARLVAIEEAVKKP